MPAEDLLSGVPPRDLGAERGGSRIFFHEIQIGEGILAKLRAAACGLAMPKFRIQKRP